jgi:signal transduction histidine kinase
MTPRSIPIITKLHPSKENTDHTQYTTALAHEIRSPLTNINLSVKMLESMEGDENLEMYLAIIARSSVRINELLNELLTDRRAEAEKHSIHQLLDEVLDMSRDRITLKDIKVAKSYCTHDDRMVLNKPEIKISLANIILNAIEVMSPGKGKLTIATQVTDGHYEIQIEDNGCGINKEDLKHLFEPYFTKRPGGLGIGLATTHAILLSNDISVQVESKEGFGTRFTLTFEKNRPSADFPGPEIKSRLYRNGSHHNLRRNPTLKQVS